MTSHVGDGSVGWCPLSPCPGIGSCGSLTSTCGPKPTAALSVFASANTCDLSSAWELCVLARVGPPARLQLGRKVVLPAVVVTVAGARVRL
jgi:hypothetical protein